MNKKRNAKSLFLHSCESRNPETVYVELSMKNHLSAGASAKAEESRFKYEIDKTFLPGFGINVYRCRV